MTKADKIVFLQEEIKRLDEEIPYTGKTPKTYKALCKKRDSLIRKLATLEKKDALTG
jgi:hypothetical protein